MIIVEGCDGAGKTTLADRLSIDLDLPHHSRASDSLTGPTKDLYGWTVADITTWYEQPLAIYDRHPLTSEHIYGPAVRNNLRPGFELANVELAHMRRYLRKHALVVICAPPREVVRDNVVNDPDGQMPGVIENLDYIYDCYGMMLYVWPLDSHIARFDYTVPDDAVNGYNGILAAAKNHKHSWRGVKYDRG